MIPLRSVLIVTLLNMVCGAPEEPILEKVSRAVAKVEIVQPSGIPIDSITLQVNDTGSVACKVTNQFGSVLKRSCSWVALTTTRATVNPASGATTSIRGVSVGTTRVIASTAGKADTIRVIVTDSAAPDTTTAPDSLPTPLRTVNVSNASALQTALDNAQPGDRIVLASGTYSGGFTGSRSSTAQNPIVVTGPRTAILSGSLDKGFTVTGNYWILNGFRVTNAVNGGVMSSGGNFNILEYLEIDHIQQAGIYIGSGSATGGATVTGNEIRYCNIHDTGVGPHPEWGEGIYLGSGGTNLDRTLNTHVHHNTIGPNIGSDGIEAKASADGNLIEFNTVHKWIMIRSNNNIVTDNIVDGPAPGPGVIGVSSNDPSAPAVNNIFHRNTGSGAGDLKVFSIGSATGTQVFCDNVAVPPSVLGVSCIP